jgi:hypothetical protein
MKRITLVLAAVLTLGLLTGCKQKKHTEDIIVRKTEAPKLQAPIRMQEYNQVKDEKWLGRQYQIDIRRVPDDSLRMVKDETGQLYVDNRITLQVFRQDGSVFFSQTFTKDSFNDYLDDDYRETGILEGLVYDRVNGYNLIFAGSVCHPQTDEYIPLVITLSNFGDVTIRRDTEMDTNGNEEGTNVNREEIYLNQDDPYANQEDPSVNQVDPYANQEDLNGSLEDQDI